MRNVRAYCKTVSGANSNARRLTIVLLAAVLFFPAALTIAQLYSQDAKKDSKVSKVISPNIRESNAVVPEQVLDVSGSSGCFLLFCDSDPKLVIVLDSSGKWVSDVKSVRYSSDFASCEVSCTVFSGSIKPSNPKVVNWVVQQVKSVGRDEFGKIIDELQVDPLYKVR